MHRRVPTATPVPALRNKQKQKQPPWMLLAPSGFPRPPAGKQSHVSLKTGRASRQSEISWTRVTTYNTPLPESRGRPQPIKQMPKAVRIAGGESPWCGSASKSDSLQWPSPACIREVTTKEKKKKKKKSFALLKWEDRHEFNWMQYASSKDMLVLPKLYHADTSDKEQRWPKEDIEYVMMVFELHLFIWSYSQHLWTQPLTEDKKMKSKLRMLVADGAFPEERWL